jgi:hypothetical protein
MSIKRKLSLFFLSGFFIIIFTPIFGNLYEKCFGPVSTWFWGPTHPEYLDGFLISYMFFIPLFIILFVEKNKYRLLILLSSVVLLFDIFLGAWEDLVIDIAVVFISISLTHLILLIYHKIKKST